MKEQTENNSNMDMKNFLCPLRRLSPTAPANSAAKTAASDTLTRSGQTQQPRRKFSNDPLFGVIFSFCSIYTTAPLHAARAYTGLLKCALCRTRKKQMRVMLHGVFCTEC